jgi:hypothetical protein
MIAAYQQPQEQPTVMLTVRWHRSSQERVLMEDCQDMADKRYWRRDCATGGRGNGNRHMAESTPRLDEKQCLDGLTLALEREIEG